MSERWSERLRCSGKQQRSTVKRAIINLRWGGALPGELLCGSGWQSRWSPCSRGHGWVRSWEGPSEWGQPTDAPGSEAWQVYLETLRRWFGLMRSSPHSSATSCGVPMQLLLLSFMVWFIELPTHSRHNWPFTFVLRVCTSANVCGGGWIIDYLWGVFGSWVWLKWCSSRHSQPKCSTGLFSAWWSFACGCTDVGSDTTAVVKSRLWAE